MRPVFALWAEESAALLANKSNSGLIEEIHLRAVAARALGYLFVPCGDPQSEVEELVDEVLPLEALQKAKGDSGVDFFLAADF
eukprot:CAMPEP_0204911934 /NCGR_PEP_ID=MMETSP1397-20131031/10173_1 /ASSEMBLY_ACC=CAM_ASM_000891 /TAXON_ID=49980 /ORGANISM="Climacostomum Climacostomum virens, Strain Stock W-24" /LENGTH=82 /DNA_ID=CAMNT_0052082671 /DNA_START=284 /DNA_END=532 /DNA_ORIENTATION=-